MVTGALSVYKRTKETLDKAGIESSQFEAKELIRYFLNISEAEIYSDVQKKFEQRDIEQLEYALEKRAGGYPLQYIIGEWEFYGYRFKVGEGLLIPRADTETLIEAVNSLRLKSPVITDLCSGSGCIAVTLEKEISGSEVYAIEYSDKAFSYLKKNIEINNSKVHAVLGDIFDEKVILEMPLSDIIVSNPPYLTEKDMNNLQKEVHFEPEMALRGGSDGLDFYKKIVSLWKKKLKNNGYIVFEIGINQEEAVSKIFKENGFSDIKYVKDLSGIIRVVLAKINQLEG